MITFEEFATEVEAFLEVHAARRAERNEVEWGVGSDRVAVFDTAPPDIERARISDATAWQATRFDAGLGWITGPKRYGGRELGPEHEAAYRRLERR
jgi:alkylation response protein AidB-like acyl-CoA dehydrogenase